VNDRKDVSRHSFNSGTEIWNIGSIEPLCTVRLRSSSPIISFVWLGPDTRDSDLAMSALREFHQRWEARSDRLKTLKIHKLGEEDIATYGQLVAQELRGNIRKRVAVLMRLFMRTWFQRAWVRQEDLAWVPPFVYSSPAIALHPSRHAHSYRL
jgi:hypothetical protein